MNVTIDYGDGTGLRTFYDAEGNVTGTEELTGLPIVEPVSPTPEEQAVALANALLADPERLAQLVALIAPSNTAKGPLEYVNEAVQSVVNGEGE